jgi:hypothetical protein
MISPLEIAVSVVRTKACMSQISLGQTWDKFLPFHLETVVKIGRIEVKLFELPRQKMF